jgi:hypothetical protein
MKHRIPVGAALAVTLLCGSVIAADAPKSGPQVGQNVSAFDVLNVCNAERAGANGTKSCLV